VTPVSLKKKVAGGALEAVNQDLNQSKLQLNLD
jgi:hypothetical protein